MLGLSGLVSHYHATLGCTYIACQPDLHMNISQHVLISFLLATSTVGIPTIFDIPLNEKKTNWRYKHLLQCYDPGTKEGFKLAVYRQCWIQNGCEA